ncbi:MAG: 2-oxoacid:acceptor oxidoreductase family protein [Ktedonobacteraceae bacterium]
MTEKTTNLVIIGTGGQGALTMMEMLALAAEIAEQEVRVLSRVSLARLGGAGICHMRLGPSSSPAIPMGEADFLLTLEMSEVLRALPMARTGARAFVSTYRRLPIAAGLAGRHYPTQTEITQALAERDVRVLFVPEHLPTEPCDNEQDHQASRVNMVMLGVLCGTVDLLPRSALEEAITLRLPSIADQNLQMFAVGWQFAKKMPIKG